MPAHKARLQVHLPPDEVEQFDLLVERELVVGVQSDQIKRMSIGHVPKDFSFFVEGVVTKQAEVGLGRLVPFLDGGVIVEQHIIVSCFL